jgi:hypothetical protein
VESGGRELRIRPDGTVEPRLPRWLSNIVGGN